MAAELVDMWVSEPDPLSINGIIGPRTVLRNAVCRWEVSPSGGLEPYGYNWDGVLTGDGSWIDGVVAEDGWLRVMVWDGFNSAVEEDSIHVDVVEVGEECGIWER